MTALHYDPDPEAHIAVITIDRAEARNAVDAEVAEGIEAALDDIEGRPELRVGILTGAPPLFSAGGDLKAIGRGEVRTLHTRRGGFAGLVRRDRTKPLIAAVDGPALGGGTEMVLACDLVVASHAASFGLPEVRRSVLAGSGGLTRLGRRVPFGVAMEWALTGDAHPAARAAELGLVNRLCAAGAALETAWELATRIAANAPVAVRLSRSLMLEATWLDESEARRRSRAAMEAVSQTVDFREGLDAFAQKRAPVWSGA